MENEQIIRLSVFFGLFAIFAIIEILIPRRKPVDSKSKRWLTNISLSVLNSVAVYLMPFVVVFVAATAAIDAGERGIGLFNMLELPGWVEVVMAILILDFAIWFQHMVFHKIPLFWRLHQVHHSDRDMDVTTAIRFHPIEIIVSMLLKVALVYLLGPAALAVILFEVILNGAAMFNHANIKLPRKVDTFVRLLVVTPDMHRIHHSSKRSEHDSNYGFSISIWDRIFRTYTADPAEGHETMEVGLRWQDEKPAKILWALKLPFVNK